MGQFSHYFMYEVLQTSIHVCATGKKQHDSFYHCIRSVNLPLHKKYHLTQIVAPAELLQISMDHG